MPYSTVASLSVGNVLPASHMNGLRANQEYMASTFPHCNIFESSAQSVANNTDTALTSDEELSDIGGMHSTSSLTDRITIPAGEGGLYSVSAIVEFAANATGQRTMYFQKNGGALSVANLAANIPASSGSNTVVLNGTRRFVYVPGDYVKCVVYQNSGGALNCTLLDFYVEWRATA